MWTVSKLKHITRILLLSVLIVSIPAEEIQASRLWDFFYKRYLKRSKMKKWAPRLLGGETPLEDLQVHDDYEVIGFEPSWLLDQKGTYEEDETYYFNLLTTLISGEYDINPETGYPRSETNLYNPIRLTKRDKGYAQQLSIYQKAYNENSRIKLLISLNYSGDFGLPGYRGRYESDILSNNDIFETLDGQLDLFYQELYKKMDVKPSRVQLGIIVDFDFNSPNADKEPFLEFLQKLHEEYPDNLIYLKIPPLIREGSAYPTEFIQDLLELDEEIVDVFVMEAYGFEKSSKELINSVHFDKEAKYSVEGSIDHYSNFELEVYDEDRLNELKETFRKMLVLELPFYGAVWERADRISPYSLKKQNNYISYDNFWYEFVGKKGKRSYSQDSMYIYATNDYNELAFGEDSLTLYRKTNYIADTLKLRGFAMNSLGYYKDKPDFLGQKTPQIWYGYANIDSLYTKKKEHLGWIIAYFIVAFIPIGFVYSVGQYWEVRNALAKHKKYFIRFRAFFFLFLFIFLVVADIVPRDTAGLIIGVILLLLLLIYIIVKKVIIRSKKYVNALK
jgi:hypothetical protein